LRLGASSVIKDQADRESISSHAWNNFSSTVQ